MKNGGHEFPLTERNIHVAVVRFIPDWPKTQAAVSYSPKVPPTYSVFIIKALVKYSLCRRASFINPRANGHVVFMISNGFVPASPYWLVPFKSNNCFPMKESHTKAL